MAIILYIRAAVVLLIEWAANSQPRPEELAKSGYPFPTATDFASAVVSGGTRTVMDSAILSAAKVISKVLNFVPGLQVTARIRFRGIYVTTYPRFCCGL